MPVVEEDLSLPSLQEPQSITKMMAEESGPESQESTMLDDVQENRHRTLSTVSAISIGKIQAEIPPSAQVNLISRIECHVKPLFS